MKVKGRLLPALAAILSVPVALLFLCATRVPDGFLGLTGAGENARALEPGYHLSRPWRRVTLIPSGPARIEREASALTPEGARVPVRYALQAAPDPARAASLIAGLGKSGQAALADSLAALVEEALAAPGAVDRLEPKVRARLEQAGLTVSGLSIRPGAAEPPGAAPASGRVVRHARRPDNPIVLIGLDGADWQIIDPLIGRGKLPNLARLKARSVWGHLRSFEPILSPLLWTTAVTGKPPDEHGIIDFLMPDPYTGRKVPITSRARRTRALWNIFSESGLSADFVAWWASWPAEPIHGRIVSDRVAYSLFEVDKAAAGLTWPAGLHAELEGERVEDASIDYATVDRFVDVPREEFDAARRRARENPEAAYKEPINHLVRILAATRTYHRMVLRLVRDGQADLTGVYYQGIDEVCHRFAHFMAPRMSMVPQADFSRYRGTVEAFYEYQDELLGELLAAVSPTSTLLVISDHGFHNGPSRPTDGPADIEGKPGKWHRLYGVVLLAGEGIRPGRFDTATLFDITPTVLALSGLPLAGDMKGRPLVKRAGAAGGPERIPTYEVGAVPSRVVAAASGAAEGADEELLRNLASLGYIGDPQPARGANRPIESAVAAAPGAAGSTVTASTNLAALLARKGDLAGAEAELRKALGKAPAYVPALISLGQVLARQGRTDEALEVTRKGIASGPDLEPGAYVQLALLAVKAGRSAQAAGFLEALRRERPRAAGIDTALGVLAESAGDSREAEARYRAALDAEPALVEPMARLFELYRRSGREDGLETGIRRALQANEQSVMHHNWLGLIQSRRADFAGAERSYKRALEIAPDFGGTMANLGSLYGRAGRLEEAAAILSRAVGIEPKNLEARVNLGAALAKLGRLEEAIASLEEARSLGVRSPELLNAVGLAYAQSGRAEEAIRALEESLSLSPDQPQVRSLISDLRRPT